MHLFISAGVQNQYLVLSEEFDCYDGFGHGTFQRHWLFIFIFAIFIRNCHSSVIPFIMGDIDHWCKKPQQWNVSTEEWKNMAIPLEAGRQYSRCRQYANPYNGSDTRTEPCTAWEYDEQVTNSMVSQWDMVCDRRILQTALVSLHAAGLTIAGIVAGFVADTIGRRPVLLAATVSLLVSTLGLCLGSTYFVHAVAKVIASGSVAAQLTAAGLIFFEVTTHENRPLHLVMAGATAAVVSHLWLAVLKLRWLVGMHWTFKQAVFVAPTILLAANIFAAVESPRWLVAKARFMEAEDVMLAAAKTNLFPLYNTACLLDKLRSKAAASSRLYQHTAAADILQGASVRKGFMALLFTSFSVHFVRRTVIYSSIIVQDPTFHWISLALAVFGFAGTLFVVTRVTLLQFISTCLTLLGVLQCMSSLTINLGFLLMKQVLFVSTRALLNVVYVVIASYSLELFPTTIRGATRGWIIGFGGLGSIVASLSKLLEVVGREDVSFAIGGSLIFGSLLFLRTLPRNTTVECAKMAVKSPSTFQKENFDHMKRTLERRECRDVQETGNISRQSKSSAGSQRSTSSARTRERKLDVNPSAVQRVFSTGL